MNQGVSSATYKCRSFKTTFAKEQKDHFMQKWGHFVQGGQGKVRVGKRSVRKDPPGWESRTVRQRDGGNQRGER